MTAFSDAVLALNGRNVGGIDNLGVTARL